MVSFFSNEELEALRKTMEEGRAQSRGGPAFTRNASPMNRSVRRVKRELEERLNLTTKEKISRIVVTRKNTVAFGTSQHRIDTSLPRLKHQTEINVMQAPYGISIVSRNGLIPGMAPEVVGPIWGNWEPATYDLGHGRTYTYSATEPASSPDGSPHGTLRPKTGYGGPVDWSRCASPERPPTLRPPYRDDLTYESAQAETSLYATGNIATDPQHPSPAFVSKLDRFAMQRPRSPDKFFPVEADAATWHKRQEGCSAFQSKTTRKSPRINVPEYKPTTDLGPKYDPDCYIKPSVRKEVASMPQRYHGAFRTRDDRFAPGPTPFARVLGPETYADAFLRLKPRQVPSYVLGVPPKRG